MKPVRPGSRGPAVEDIQRRLLLLGFDLGSTGVDGVFLGKTTEAVREFQLGLDIDANGEIDAGTWAALVDATFTLGDRMLFLRIPYFHGRDVRVLQEALNTLGFSCGQPDGIFGTHTEHAVHEFQANCGQSADGIVGLETVKAVKNLRHVWDGKDGRPPTTARLSLTRAAEVLASTRIVLAAEGSCAEDVADRIVNLAQASEPRALVSRVPEGAGDGGINITVLAGTALPSGIPVVAATDDALEMSGRILTALSAQPHTSTRQFVVSVAPSADEHERQRVAVRVLDALCVALA